MIRGKTNDFVKFRATRMMSPTANGKRSRSDTSFHVSPDKIDAWIHAIKEESERFPDQIYRAVPALLELVQKMMLHQATLRPLAMQVRDRIQEILVGEGGVEKLCCSNREWGCLEIADDAIDTSAAFYKEREELAAGIAAGQAEAADTEAGAQISRFEDSGSVLSKANSVKNRRRSSTASAATAKMTSWRRAFSRSGQD